MSQVSVITPVRPTTTVPPLLERAYRSLQVQSLQDWEWLVVLDDHDQPSAAWLPREAQQDQRVQAVCLGRNSRSTAITRNAALSLARGVTVVPLDDDDLLLPGALEAYHAALQQHPTAAAVLGQAYMLDGATVLERERPPYPAGLLPAGALLERWEALGSTGFHYNAVAYRSSPLLARGGWPGVIINEDAFLLMSVAQQHPVVHHDAPTMLWRQHASGQSQHPEAKQLRVWGKQLLAAHLGALTGRPVTVAGQRARTVTRDSGLTLAALGVE